MFQPAHDGLGHGIDIIDLQSGTGRGTANLAKAEHAKRRARAAGLELVFDGPTFNEFVLDVGVEATDRLLRLAEQGEGMLARTVGGFEPLYSQRLP